MIYLYKVKAYAVLVRGGRMTLTAEDNKDKLPIVPDAYKEAVAEYIVK